MNLALMVVKINVTAVEYMTLKKVGLGNIFDVDLVLTLHFFLKKKQKNQWTTWWTNFLFT